MYNIAMDERRIKIKDLEAKKSSDIKAREQLLEGLGEALFTRIGTDEPFDSNAEGTPGGVLAEYRKLQREVAESEEKISSLEKEVSRLKDFEETISARGEERSRLEKELAEAYTGIGKALLEEHSISDAPESAQQHADSLLARIDGQETKLEELERQEGGIIKWLGKSAQITVSKALLSKDKSTLRRLYREAGEKYIAEKPVESLTGDNIETVKKAFELKKFLIGLSEDMSGLREECRKIEDLFGGRDSPSRRVRGLEKHIANTKGKYLNLYQRMGHLAAEKRDLLASILNEKDDPVFEMAGVFQSQVAQSELQIEKIKASISVDEEKDEIEKMKKTIVTQQQKIVAAEETIAGLEKQISGSEHRIGELEAFIQDDHAGKNQ